MAAKYGSRACIEERMKEKREEEKVKLLDHDLIPACHLKTCQYCPVIGKKWCNGHQIWKPNTIVCWCEGCVQERKEDKGDYPKRNGNLWYFDDGKWKEWRSVESISPLKEMSDGKPWFYDEGEKKWKPYCDDPSLRNVVQFVLSCESYNRNVDSATTTHIRSEMCLVEGLKLYQKRANNVNHEIVISRSIFNKL